jgi:hypothetical protein
MIVHSALVSSRVGLAITYLTASSILYICRDGKNFLAPECSEVTSAPTEVHGEREGEPPQMFCRRNSTYLPPAKPAKWPALVDRETMPI